MVTMSKEKFSSVGGQAVIEGVMMRNADLLATAVRKPNGDIVYKKTKYRKVEINFLLSLLSEVQ